MSFEKEGSHIRKETGFQKESLTYDGKVKHLSTFIRPLVCM